MRRLLYVVDPMCSWCYGFAPVLAELEAELAPDVTVGLVMGGLAPDDDEPMDPATRRYVQRAWREVAARCGVRFDHRFWSRCRPRRSTYPACRAVLVADGHGLAREMLQAIQRAYYQEARNPSDSSTLAELAREIGVDPGAFLAALGSPETQRRLEVDLALRRRLGADSFPSLAIEDDRPSRLISRGWIDAGALRAALGAAGLFEP
ncbi:MAG: DsbA family protein [Planctomycetes bacterium]|nr:DsbA family protein [Planctomycetota bacterium]